MTMTTTITPESPSPASSTSTNRRWVSVDEAAGFFGCSRRTLDRNLERLPTLRVGRVIRVDLLGAERVLMAEGLGR